MGALDSGIARSAELLMMFGDLTTLRVDDSKNNGVKLAETVVGVTTIFSLFGSFSIMVICIFLVSVLLALKIN